MELTEQQQERLKKILSIEKNPTLAILDGIEPISTSLEAIQAILSDESSKDDINYQSDILSVIEAINGLKDTLTSKEMVVNVESNLSELEAIKKALVDLLNESKKEQSINVKLVIE